jgi:polar amino acid transport system permease protein
MGQILHLYFDLHYWWLSLPALLLGCLKTIELAAATIVTGLSLGWALAVLRALGIRVLSWPIVVFVDVFRALPSIIVIFLLFFALPYADIRLSAFVCAAGALSANLAAVAEEALWAGIQALPRGQSEAARVLGLGRLRMLRLVILPQAARLARPLLINKTISITKDTSLAAVVAVPELLNQMSTEQGVYANPSPLMLGALLFLLMFAPLVQWSRRVERRGAAR